MGNLWDLPNHLGFPALSLHILFQPPAFLFEPSLQSCQEPVAETEMIFWKTQIAQGEMFGISGEFFLIPHAVLISSQHVFFSQCLLNTLKISFGGTISQTSLKSIMQTTTTHRPDHDKSHSGLPWVVPNCPKQNAIGQLQSYPCRKVFQDWFVKKKHVE